jgi:hypothetical protein
MKQSIARTSNKLRLTAVYKLSLTPLLLHQYRYLQLPHSILKRIFRDTQLASLRKVKGNSGNC